MDAGPIDLSGSWRAIEGTDELRMRWLDDDHDDGAWAPIEVPGHWRAAEAFADSDGPLLHRHRFLTPAAGRGLFGPGGHGQAGPGAADRWWLVFDGIFYEADVWLDGAYLGATEGYFAPHTFEVTEPLAARSEHVLGVDVTCSPPGDLRAKRAIVGAFHHADDLAPGWNPGGIWRPVRLERSGPVRISGLQVRCREAGPEQAVVELVATFDASRAGPVRIRTTVGGIDAEEVATLAAGHNARTWTVAVPDPPLWWPHSLGDQPLVDVTVTVVPVTGDDGDRELGEADDGWTDAGPASDRRALRTGLRQVRMRSWVWSVNGERLFVKGATQGPSRQALGEISGDQLRADVQAAVDAGLDLLRVHAHVSRPELYEAADEAGLLLWQDMPLRRGYARSIRKQAQRQARAMVDLLAHHPSVALWCGHDEPYRLVDAPAPTEEDGPTVARYLAAQELPSWNRTVLDRSVRRALAKADPSRPVIGSSGVLPHLPDLDGTDAHLWFGWAYGEAEDLADLARAVPRLARFVTGLGAQSAPDSADWCEPHLWPALDWNRLGAEHGLDLDLMERRVPSADHDTFASWRAATQAHQAEVVRLQVELLRRLKYRPTGGFCVTAFADGHPSVSMSVLDHERRPKAALAALAEACRPVIAVTDPLPQVLAAGDALALDVHVVNDLRRALDGIDVTATLRWEGGDHAWHWLGGIPADECVRVGTVQAVVPDGTDWLELVLEWSPGGDGAAHAGTRSARAAVRR